MLIELSNEGYSFGLSVVGQSYKNSPKIFEDIQDKLSNHLLHFGFQKSLSDYASVLNQSTILPVTSNQDFFGGSVVEAIYSGVYPLLPNRLAYPSHIPEDLHAEYLYSSKEELGFKLRQLLSPVYKLGVNESLVNFVKSYDWSILSTVYDRTLKTISS